MSRPRFSEFLSNRRRQLGLSVAQAARVLRLKDQVIVAFEEGDWDRIPRAGYAQGMLSSYARYLGLNPREVIDLFQEDLAAYSNAGSPRREGPRSEAYGDDPVYELPNTTASSARAHGPGVDKDLYGSAGPAGSILTGASVSGTYLSSSSPLVNGRAAGYSDRYLQQQGVSQNTSTLQRTPSQGRPYTGRTPQSRQGRTGQPRQARSRTSRASDDARRLSGDGIATRRTASYADDLRYEQASPYESASTAQGRNASHNIARPQRPNVRRRPSAEQRGRLARTQKPPKSGVAGVVEAWFSDSRRTMLTVFALVAVVLILIISLSVKSCVASTESTEKDTQASVPVSSVTSQSGSDTSATTTTPSSSSSSSTSTSSTGTAAETTGPVTVKVQVPEGSVSWIEVLNGGASLQASTVTGPWEQSYTVDGTLTVRASDPTAVEVTVDGKPVKFDTMVSGIGTATVQGPAQTDEAEGTDGASATGDQSGADASTSDTQGQTLDGTGSASQAGATSQDGSTAQ